MQIQGSLLTDEDPGHYCHMDSVLTSSLQVEDTVCLFTQTFRNWVDFSFCYPPHLETRLYLIFLDNLNNLVKQWQKWNC